MVIDLGKDNTNGCVFACAQITRHDVGLVVETFGAIAHQCFGGLADVRVILQSATDGRNRYP